MGAFWSPFLWFFGHFCFFFSLVSTFILFVFTLCLLLCVQLRLLIQCYSPAKMPRARSRLLPPDAICCDWIMAEFQCQTDVNGNRNRWMRKCKKCRRSVFDDREGYRENNPLCYCHHPSRLQHETNSNNHWTYRCLFELCGFKRSARRCSASGQVYTTRSRRGYRSRPY